MLFGDDAVLGAIVADGSDAVRAKPIAAHAALRDGRCVWVIFTGMLIVVHSLPQSLNWIPHSPDEETIRYCGSSLQVFVVFAPVSDPARILYRLPMVTA